jgi:2-keto-4-pentenoate hydratase/2-oxohepta-3-ene-1,7-dioic acid hydratase in catechol pathway
MSERIDDTSDEVLGRLSAADRLDVRRIGALKDGETIECEIEGIGIISNPVHAER